MTGSSPDSHTEIAFSADLCDELAAQVLQSAASHAQLTCFEQIEPAHMALAILNREKARLAPILKSRFKGLEVGTVVESLLDAVEIVADMAGSQPGNFADAPQPHHFSNESIAVLERAGELAARQGRPLSIEAICVAVFENPDSSLIRAFADAGVSKAELQSLAEDFEALETATQPGAELPALFTDGLVNFDAFGPLSRAVLQSLRQAAANEPGRMLRDTDLLAHILNQEQSRLVEALHILGLPVARLRRRLALLSGGDLDATSAMRDAESLSASCMSRLLRRLLEAAAELARSEGCSLIAESHLVRAHIARVGWSGNNVYDTLGIDTQFLSATLARYKTDRDTGAAATQAPMIENMEDYLLARVVGQAYAINSVLPSLKRMRQGFVRPGRPIGVFLFVGATGVGKTELAKAIADVVFGPKPGVQEPYLIRVECEKFKNHDDIIQLVGARQGLVGYKQGLLTNGLRDKPRAVVLFDEAEKAHEQVWQSLLSFFDEGIVREPDGTQYDATGCVLVATSNLGYKEAMQQFDLWQATPEQQEAVRLQVEEFVYRQIEDYFSPEFRARFGRERMIFFNHFTESVYRQIVRLQVGRLSEEMRSHGLEVTVSQSAINLLTDLAWRQRKDGARPVERLVNTHLLDQVVDARAESPGRRDFSFTALEGSQMIVLEN
jgi:ATP-dependent Clp protease ATP-binding subunit ClpA